MVQVLPASGPFGTFANVAFLLVSLFSDILLIRLCLCIAYVFLIIGASTGFPRWQDFTVQPVLAVDGLVWSSVCLLLHGFALFQLLRDERRIKFKSEDEEQLWRFFYRRSGMGRLEMKEVLKRGKWMRVRAGKRILSDEESQVRVCLLVEGLAGLETTYYGWEDPGKPMMSGSMFDFGLLNVFGVFIGFEKNEFKSLRAVALSDCLLYSWSLAELEFMATKCAPVVAAFWRNLILCQLGLEFEMQTHTGARPVCATGEREPATIFKGGRSRDFTDPLRSYEKQPATVKGFFSWIGRSLHPFLPPGIRHTALPKSGIMARNRVVAVKTAHAWRALSRQPSNVEAPLLAPPAAEGEGVAWCSMVQLVPAVSKDGGAAAYRMLKRMQSMRQILALDLELLANEEGSSESSQYPEEAGTVEHD